MASNILDNLVLRRVYSNEGFEVAFLFSVVRDTLVPSIPVSKLKDTSYFPMSENERVNYLECKKEDSWIRLKKGSSVLLNYREVVVLLLVGACPRYIRTFDKNYGLVLNVVYKDNDRQDLKKSGYRLMLVRENPFGYVEIGSVFSMEDIIRDSKLVDESLFQEYQCYLKR